MLQNEKPLSFEEVPGYFFVSVAGGLSSVVVGVLGVSLERNLSRVVCFRGPTMGVLVVGGTVFVSVGVWLGLCISSPVMCGTLAEIRMSLRFFGRLYPVISFLRWIWAVVLLVPKMSQFLCTISRSESSFGLKVVVKNTLSVLVVLVGRLFGSSSLSLSSLMTVSAASSIKEEGYPLLLKCRLILSTFCS